MSNPTQHITYHHLSKIEPTFNLLTTTIWAHLLFSQNVECALVTICKHLCLWLN